VQEEKEATVAIVGEIKIQFLHFCMLVHAMPWKRSSVGYQ
jgi:hypothetical protein